MLANTHSCSCAPVWNVQVNLIPDINTVDSIRLVCKSRGYDFNSIQIIPFSPSQSRDQIDFKRINIFYGSTTLGDAARSDKGFFYDPLKFNYKMYLNMYGDRMFNSEAEVIMVKEFYKWAKETDFPDSVMFCRPNNDLKSFSGQVMSIEAWKNYFTQLMHVSTLDKDTYDLYPYEEIVVGEAYAMHEEFRCVMVEGKCVEISQYRDRENKLKYHRIADTYLAQQLKVYAEETARIYSPNPVFVLDLAMDKDGPAVLEAGCFNWAGLYACDIKNVVEAVTAYRLKLG